MKISARGEYACRALLELALRHPDPTPLQVREISRRQGIPRKYLVQLLLQLKRAGLVESLRGKQGGYRLGRAPEKISLGDALRATAAAAPGRKAGPDGGIFEEIWAEIQRETDRLLEKQNFRAIVERYRVRQQALLYQI